MTTDFLKKITAEDEPVQYKHNWLYSVLPITKRYDNNRTHVLEQDALYLSGYCRACNNAFSVEIPRNEDNSVRVTNLDIPKWGCISPEEAAMA